MRNIRSLQFFLCSVVVFHVAAQTITASNNNINNISPKYGDEIEAYITNNSYVSTNPKIVGGTEVDITEYPHQLSLSYNGNHICGASLIGFRWAITAAHCTRGMVVDHLAIRAGSSFRNRGGQVVKVKYVFVHPLYNPGLLDYDIALLELIEQVTIWSASLIVLPSESMVIPVGTYATVAGWGAVSEAGTLRYSQLQAVKIPIISSYWCQKQYPNVRITPRMFCAGYLGQGGKDSCRGDSGGGLVVDRVLLGIVSWGYGCGRAQYPGVYTFVPSLINFIRSVIWRENFG